jgi:hypothetical protein
LSSAAKEVLDYERDVTSALKKFYNRTHWEPNTEKTPLHDLLDKEEHELDEWAVRNETTRRLFEYFAADGPDPVNVMRRVYALGSHMSIAPFCELNLREKALMLGDSHGAQHWRMKKICVDPLRRNGAKAYKAPGQKGLGASASAAAAQQGNSNRRKKRTGHAASKGKQHYKNGKHLS